MRFLHSPYMMAVFAIGYSVVTTVHEAYFAPSPPAVVRTLRLASDPELHLSLWLPAAYPSPAFHWQTYPVDDLVLLQHLPEQISPAVVMPTREIGDAFPTSAPKHTATPGDPPMEYASALRTAPKAGSAEVVLDLSRPN